ncbi:mechanosensitive ion channel domain-containing protein [Pseudothauera rhizosphaerae]|uniref:Small-conductance mechanosensitive channel n=1 Tax=Pseudothauera rhizosphaerae TaxID=2565932 RepID=A0A4S4AK33_9RHOO|nr:mechanosensitive ion channel family protein [Pseudothauera rhizosphaerae]THF59369.1 mechanosensitive ion channel family protein [Pseudothauera rhizosphaerae]
MKSLLPEWAHPWLDLITLGAQVALILLCAGLLHGLLRRLVRRLAEHYGLPPGMAAIARRLSGIVIYSGALVLLLDRFGVSGTVLWTAFTGFATVAAVAFFAAWSVLSNIFCALLIFTTRPFRLHDQVELLENGEKPGLKGEVIDINLVYTTLQERLPDGSNTVLRLPNSLFFQRAIRCWRDTPPA